MSFIFSSSSSKKNENICIIYTLLEYFIEFQAHDSFWKDKTLIISMLCQWQNFLSLSLTQKGDGGELITLTLPSRAVASSLPPTNWRSPLSVVLSVVDCWEWEGHGKQVCSVIRYCIVLKKPRLPMLGVWLLPECCCLFPDRRRALQKISHAWKNPMGSRCSCHASEG